MKAQTMKKESVNLKKTNWVETSSQFWPLHPKNAEQSQNPELKHSLATLLSSYVQL